VIEGDRRCPTERDSELPQKPNQDAQKGGKNPKLEARKKKTEEGKMPTKV